MKVWSSSPAATSRAPAALTPPQERDHWLRCRQFAGAGWAIAIHTPDPHVRRRIDDLFAAMPPAPAGTCAPALDIWLAARDELGPDGIEPWYDLWIGEQFELSTRRLWRCEDRLLARMNRATLDADSTRLHLHAGLVSNDRDTVLIVGPSGSGKSTLVAALALAGWTYHADEMVAIDLASISADGYPRPLTLKRSGFGLFGDLPTLVTARSESSREQAHVPPSEVGGRAGAGAGLPTAIINVGHTAGPPSIEPLPAIDALLGMVGEALDLERAGQAAMDALIELAARVPAFALRSGQVALTIDALTATLDRTQPPRPAAASLTRDHGSPSCFAETTIGWAIGDEGVLYDLEGGTVVRLDRSAVEASRALATNDSVDRAADQLASLTGTDRSTMRADLDAFVSELTVAGMVPLPSDA
ncbi:MAG: PqqD family peptide modification chaperone [Actinobacteria bacterium]|nr:PqqD family peptide modification chaperone [Actinomycetota bacterium]